MGFTKHITIQTDTNHDGPGGLDEIYIILGFNQDAIKTAQIPFSGLAWKHVSHQCTINPKNNCANFGSRQGRAFLSS